MSRGLLEGLCDAGALEERLVTVGLSQAAAREKARLIVSCAKELGDLDQSATGACSGEAESTAGVARVFFVPGRIEVLGKHTDYAGGRSLLAAIEKGFCLVAVPRRDAMVRMINAATGERAEFGLDPELSPTVGSWSNYPMTVARRIARNFVGPLMGAEIAFASDLPPASGMSSSSAFMIATFLALAAVNRLDEQDAYRREIDGLETLAGYLGTVENGQSFGALAGDKGVGTFGGSQDHTAILCSRALQLVQYSFCPVRFERRIAQPEGTVFAVAFSGVVAEKTGEALEKYNRASRRASEAVALWRRATGREEPHLAAIVKSVPDATERLRRILAESNGGGSFTRAELTSRFEQFLAESERIIPEAGDALARGDLAAFGARVDESQDLTGRLLGNQVPETVFLARAARELGAHGASAFGAGFGGSVWALVQEEGAAEFLETWARRYREAFPGPAAQAAFFCSHAGGAAFELI